jgi:hypothetical protein
MGVICREWNGAMALYGRYPRSFHDRYGSISKSGTFGRGGVDMAEPVI